MSTIKWNEWVSTGCTGYNGEIPASFRGRYVLYSLLTVLATIDYPCKYLKASLHFTHIMVVWKWQNDGNVMGSILYKPGPVCITRFNLTPTDVRRIMCYCCGPPWKVHVEEWVTMAFLFNQKLQCWQICHLPVKTSSCELIIQRWKFRCNSVVWVHLFSWHLNFNVLDGYCNFVIGQTVRLSFFYFLVVAPQQQCFFPRQ